MNLVKCAVINSNSWLAGCISEKKEKISWETDKKDFKYILCVWKLSKLISGRIMAKTIPSLQAFPSHPHPSRFISALSLYFALTLGLPSSLPFPCLLRRLMSQLPSHSVHLTVTAWFPDDIPHSCTVKTWSQRMWLIVVIFILCGFM